MQRITKIEKFISLYEYPGTNTKAIFRVAVSSKWTSNFMPVVKHCRTIKEARDFKKYILSGSLLNNSNNYNFRKELKEENKKIIKEIKNLKKGNFYTLERSCTNMDVKGFIKRGFNKTKIKHLIRIFQGASNIYYILKIK